MNEFCILSATQTRKSAAPLNHVGTPNAASPVNALFSHVAALENRVAAPEGRTISGIGPGDRDKTLGVAKQLLRVAEATTRDEMRCDIFRKWCEF